MNPLTQSKNTTILPVLIALTLACFGLSPTPNAFGVDPPPDGGYANQNTAEGEDALFSLTTGANNSAHGFNALYNNTTGGSNTAVGDQTLYSNTTGSGSTAIGYQALYSYSQSYSFARNTAVGYQALYNDTLGYANTAIGESALLSNTDGTSNTASGFDALFRNTTGGGNTATGYLALYSNKTGNFNTANGIGALFSNAVGSSNVALGQSAGVSLTTGTNNILLGTGAGSFLTTGNNNIDIGNNGVAGRGESKRIRIGTVGTHTKTFIAGIRDVTTENADAIPVLIDAAGQLGTMSSSRRFKKEIKPMDQTSEAILGLKPVTFHYKSDPAGAGPQFGLIAEEVAQVNPDLVVRDENGEIYTVRYDAVNAMLLNEFLKEHRKGEQEDRKIAELEATVAKLQSVVQKVSDRLEASKSAPQVVADNQ